MSAENRPGIKAGEPRLTIIRKLHHSGNLNSDFYSISRHIPNGHSVIVGNLQFKLGFPPIIRKIIR